MIEIERHIYDGKKRTYKVYTQEEADEKGLDYVYWRDVEEEGQWALTDDGYVCKCYRIYILKSGAPRRIMLTGGAAFDQDASDIHFEEHHKYGTYLYEKPQTHKEKEAKKGRSQVVIGVYARERLQGVPHKDMPWDLLGKLYRPNQPDNDQIAEHALRSKEFQRKVADEITKILEEEGFTKREVVKEYKDLIRSAKESDDRSNLRKTLDKITEMMGIDKPEKETVRQIEAVQYKEITGDIEREERSLKGKEVKQVPEKSEGKDDG